MTPRGFGEGVTAIQGAVFVLRALIVLAFMVGLSIAATLYFGKEVLLALGLILVQLKIVAKKAVTFELPAFLVWVKTQASAFFRIELLKKWLTTTVVPMVLGKTVLRRISGFFKGYLTGVTSRYQALLAWYGRLSPWEKGVSALILIFATLALSVTSLGLWLIVFSVQVPLWIVATAGATWRMIWGSVQKSGFKMFAFLQLAWLWKAMQRLLPRRVLRRKRAFDYRVARAVIRRRRLTVRQLADKKDSLPFRLGLMVDYLFGSRG